MALVVAQSNFPQGRCTSYGRYAMILITILDQGLRTPASLFFYFPKVHIDKSFQIN
jgi:hypothetical protein